MKELVEADLEDIRNSDAPLVMAKTPSWGTAMEMRYAWAIGRPCYTVIGIDRPCSPWLAYHSKAIYATLGEAIDAIEVACGIR